MATTTQHAPGTFCWVELGTTDPEGAKKFYGSLFGWQIQDQDVGGGEIYTIFKHGARDVAALFKLRKEQLDQKVPPHWGSYVAVESADQAATKAKQLGGTVLMDPFDVMEHGRMAVIQDPTGAVFCVWQAKAHPGAGVLDEPGSLTWTELMTSNTDKALAFYTGLLPWSTEKMMSGPPDQQFPYTMYKTGDTYAGGMMPIQPDMGPMPSHWMSYFMVDDCDASTAKAQKLGAKVHVPGMDIPNMGRFSILQDPQGAVFALFAPKRQG